MAIVPVGITKYRTDPYPLQQFDREGAARVIDMVEKWQKKFQQEEGRTFLYLGDEFYFLAGREVPPTEFYDGFPQLDNGIGLTRSFINDWNLTSQNSDMSNGYDEPFVIDVVTGTSVAPVMEKLAKSLNVRNLQVRIVPVENKHFGSTVNVSGLLTAKDIIDTLQAMPEADKRQALIIPEPALRAGEDIFLDDMTLQEFAAHFPNIRVEPVQGGADYYHALTDWANYHKNRSGETAYTWQSNAGYTKPVE